MKKTCILLLSALAALTSCTGSKPEKSHSLIVYYSQTGTTEKVAQIFRSMTGADIMRIQAETAYIGDFNATIQRCQEEMKSDSVPALLPFDKQVADYDTIYLGYPVWFGIPAQPMNSFLRHTDLTGKVVIPFCTFGSGGNTSIARVESAMKGGKVPGWYGVRTARIAKAGDEVEDFLISLGIRQGERPALANFSDQQPLTDDDKALFDAACGSYPMPLGTPVSVGSRAIAGGTEYSFTCQSATPDGATSSSTIYVRKMDNGEAPEFTQVVR